MVGLVRNEVVRAADISARIVSLVAATTLDPAKHEGRILLLSLLAGFDVTLPPATGSGAIYHFKVGIVRTSGDYGILVANANDTIDGGVLVNTDNASDAVVGFTASGANDSFTMNASTTGGVVIGDWVEFVDILANQWSVAGQITSSGSEVTPFGTEVS